MSEKEVLNSVDIAIVVLYFVAILGIGIKVNSILLFCFFVDFCSLNYLGRYILIFHLVIIDFSFQNIYPKPPGKSDKTRRPVKSAPLRK